VKERWTDSSFEKGDGRRLSGGSDFQMAGRLTGLVLSRYEAMSRCAKRGVEYI
jgi:hypothetical protein